MQKKGNKIISLLVLIISVFFANNYVQKQGDNNTEEIAVNQQNTKKESFNNDISHLIKARASGKIITIKAKVINILPDDNKGDRHQKMIVKVGENTLLLAHNIDIAKRVPVSINQWIEIKGEYEWNNKGGVIHWTHRDLRNRHENGWIKHNNKKYH